VSAVAAGMRCIIVPNPLASDPDLSAASYIVETVSEIPSIVSGLLRQE
jgi:beta-phosphoglucomutase-like phosphatase (HAD superfamily)